MEYTVVSFEARSLSGAKSKLEEAVTKLLKSGWELQGGVSVSMDAEVDFYVLCQAMVKKITN